MKNKITTVLLSFSLLISFLPVQIFAQEVPYYTNDYSVSDVYGNDFTSPSTYSNDYTSQYTYSNDYTSPTTYTNNYTSPTTYSNDYVSPTTYTNNYTAPYTYSNDYTSPTTYTNNYSAPSTNWNDFTGYTYGVSSSNWGASNYSTNWGNSTPSYVPTYSVVTTPSVVTSGPICNSEQYLENGVCRSITHTCPDGSVAYGMQQCPTTTVIPGTNTVVCANGSTPINGSCSTVTTIPVTHTTVCSNGQLPVNGMCTVVTTIPTVATTLCSNGSYPVNGSCTVTTTIPFVSTTVCSNGSAPINGSCTVTNTIPTVVTTRCSDGSYPILGTCTSVNTIPTIVTNRCSNGSLPINGSCTITNTIPTVSTTLCSNGSYPVNGSCLVTNTIPTVITTTCSDGLARNYDGSCVRTTTITATQICSDGSRIPTTQACPSPYKVCANGTYVLLNQSCFVPVTPVYVPPTIVKFNNVVTSVATQITNTSGRCNGIGLIANGVSSTGWFEYGETANLGRTTGSASIGNAVTAPFSNVLANLKPNTTYYCRAVMQNQYGIVKGEIVSFVTKTKAVQYVKTVTTKKVTKVTTKEKTKPVVSLACVDGTYVPAKNATTTVTLSEGNKLMTLQVEKTEGKLVANSPVSYKISYKNLSESRLTGVVVKVVIPVEVTSLMATTGTFDENTHTLTLNQDTIDAYSEGVITISGKLASDAPIGKTIVTTSYVSYTVPGTMAQDEVTAYVVGSILPTETIAKSDTGAKKVIGANSDRGFMPSTLVEWLALIAIIAIIFILARSIYISYKEDEGGASGH